MVVCIGWFVKAIAMQSNNIKDGYSTVTSEIIFPKKWSDWEIPANLLALFMSKLLSELRVENSKHKVINKTMWYVPSISLETNDLPSIIKGNTSSIANEIGITTNNVCFLLFSIVSSLIKTLINGYWRINFFNLNSL